MPVLSPAIPSMSPRNGTYSPNGTRRTFSYRAPSLPSGRKTTDAFTKDSESMPSVTPTTSVVSRSLARSESSRPSFVVLTGPSTSTTFSGHRTRSTGGTIISLAFRCRSKTSRESVSSARVPWGPPPWTRATSSVPMSWPEGATSDTPIMTATPASEPTATRQLRSHAADSATPMTPTRKTTPMAHTTRAVWASGAAAWLMAVVASGTPPKGKVHRAASASVNAAGTASHRIQERSARPGTSRPATPR